MWVEDVGLFLSSFALRIVFSYFSDSPWLQRSSGGGELAAILRAVSSTSEGETSCILRGLDEAANRTR